MFLRCTLSVAAAALLSGRAWGQEGDVVQSELSKHLNEMQCDKFKTPGKCRKNNCVFDEDARTCTPKAPADRCPEYPMKLPREINRCWEMSFGACRATDDETACVPRAMPDTCQPCVGYPQSICGGFYSEADCKAKHLGDVNCRWVGFKSGMGCTKDWFDCDSELIGNSIACNEDTWGECRWNVLTTKCEKNLDYPDCEPCSGGGKCALNFQKQICKEMEAADLGCKWKGWANGPNCKAEDPKGFKCFSAGDPHVHGFEPDLSAWDFMGIGDYVFLDSPAFKIHVRQQETRSELVTSITAISWWGPGFPCMRGTKTCSNTCGKTFELHIGHRKGKHSNARLGEKDFDPTLIVSNEDGTYQSWTGRANIIDALVNGNLCEGMTVDNPRADELTIETYDYSTIRLTNWDHPIWGMTFYIFLVDKGAYDYFNPPSIDEKYAFAMCQLACNPVTCADTLFTYFPDPAHAENPDFKTRYSGLRTPYSDYRNHGCETMPTTECEDRPDPITECPEEIRQAADDLCSPVCDKETTKSCIFDACVAEDIAFAEEYVDTCATVIIPVPVPVPSPTYEPTPFPTNPQCGAIFSDLCQQDSMDCGTEGVIFLGVNKKAVKLFQLKMDAALKTSNACACESYCMAKGGYYWLYQAPAKKPSSSYVVLYKWLKKYKLRGKDTVCSKYRPIEHYTCTCWDDTYAKGVIADPNNKKVKKNVKKTKKGVKMGRFFGGEVGGTRIYI